MGEGDEGGSWQLASGMRPFGGFGVDGNVTDGEFVVFNGGRGTGGGEGGFAVGGRGFGGGVW